MPAPAPSAPPAAPALQALLEALVDYAGLFPPAALPLDAAVRRYARYRSGSDAWMLARLVLPAARLAALPAYAPHFSGPFGVAVLASGGDTAEAFLAALDADLAAMQALEAAMAGLAVPDVLEARLPGALLAAAQAEVQAFLEAVHARLEAAARPAALFVEVPLDAPDALPPVLDALARAGAGLKLRTGGLEAAAFPPADRLALALTLARDRGVRFKATAGLHHPVTHFAGSVGARMYGFLNVFGGAVLAHALGLEAAALQAVLEDDDPAAFRLHGTTLAWRDHLVPAEAVRDARTWAVSFGSCSFDEPRDDLRTLGLL